MKTRLLITFFLVSQVAGGQNTDALELLQQGRERPLDPESFGQEWQYRRRHPLSLNSASADELLALGLSGQQVQALLAHRRQLGPLVAIEELQAVPFWDAETIARVQPFVTTEVPQSISSLWQQLRGGDHQAVLRWGRRLPQPSGAASWRGSPDRLYARYRYRHQDGLRWGITAAKDAGEPLFRRGSGVDFLSFHLAGTGKGMLRQWYLGDYQVNLGQGLLCWQGLAFGPGADLSLLKRQGPVLTPLLAGDEFGYFRGAAAALQRGRWVLHVFGSRRRLDAPAGADSSGVGALRTGGYHRTPAEEAAQGRLAQWAGGARLAHEWDAFRVAAQVQALSFSEAILPAGEAYRRFALSGRGLTSSSIDWSGTWRNLHFFGEYARGGTGGALVQGLLFSAGTQWDGALLLRLFAPGYTHIYGAPADHWGQGANEQGLYLGFQLRPAPGWQLATWADGARAPWLRYRLDGSSGAFGGGLQATWKPERKLEADLRLRLQDEDRPAEGAEKGLRPPEPQRRVSARFVLRDDRSAQLTMQARAEAVWTEKEGGYLLGAGCKAHTIRWGNVSFRFLLFHTDTYDTRIYVADPDAGGGAGIFPVYGRGYRYSLFYQYQLGRRTQVTLYYAASQVGADTENGLLPRSEWALQMRSGF
ncbi:helix-hairpin-helix domain-containing protein [Flaviaesturariibacter flavus]|uniref:Helix-hairpin-helix domain-containing protein n=1 Tax=Flaviaesturariibacter flavus TaxID=2502780 RepID=A0A4R1B5I0_9BACT|nr:helix-hairpin-helix domain-containing protein [Flaviaesturariibacter flavus]TCJ13392.1 helix-hairpin-helix domain-containing protein [Flaviaesturariibacter flavus]